tara:strand:+ start:235 stop:381 length:147 start_codon:yes stop_codon:yes gene_type:complete
MLNVIIDLLKNANGETENIRIAQGKYKLPKTIKETLKQVKNELSWIKK